MEQELKRTMLQVELDRHRALDTLWKEHLRVLERSRSLSKKRRSALINGLLISIPGSSRRNKVDRRKSASSRKSKIAKS